VDGPRLLLLPAVGHPPRTTTPGSVPAYPPASQPTPLPAVPHVPDLLHCPRTATCTAGRTRLPYRMPLTSCTALVLPPVPQAAPACCTACPSTSCIGPSTFPPSEPSGATSQSRWVGRQAGMWCTGAVSAAAWLPACLPACLPGQFMCEQMQAGHRKSMSDPVRPLAQPWLPPRCCRCWARIWFLCRASSATWPAAQVRFACPRFLRAAWMLPRWQLRLQ
jgi:hypothetical protein